MSETAAAPDSEPSVLPPGWLPPTDAPPPSGPLGRPLDFSPPPAPARAYAAAGPGEPAAYMQRVGAAVLDFFIRFAIALPFVILFGLLFDVSSDGIVVGSLIGQIAALPYEPLMMGRTGGQTVGHRATGTRIVLSDGRRIDTARAFQREVLVKWLLFEAVGGLLFGIPTLLNYAWPLWDGRNEALHDKICSTRVIRA